MANVDDRDVAERERLDMRHERDREYDRDRESDRDRDYRSRDTRPSRFVTATETRRAFGTTEFWLALITSVVVVIAGYWHRAHLDVTLAWALGCGVMALYILSRGIAKAGSETQKIRDLD
jgi:hypothetical protein